MKSEEEEAFSQDCHLKLGFSGSKVTPGFIVACPPEKNTTSGVVRSMLQIGLFD